MIIKSTWLTGFGGDPPTLDLVLADGSCIRIGYDTDYHHRLLWRAANLHDDPVSCNASETGLDRDELYLLCDQVEAACRAEDDALRTEYLESTGGRP